MARAPLTDEELNPLDPATRMVLNVESMGITPDKFFRLCTDNPDLSLELTAQKELVIMTLPGGKTGRRNEIICTNLGIWARQNGTGITFVPLTLFVLPNGAMRAPDASWLRCDRWDALTDEQQESAPPLCPDFVVELMPKSDGRRLKVLQAKMTEYIDNGAQLGWLIDPFKKNVYIYRPGQPVQCLEDPTTIHGDPVLPGFVFHVSEIW